MDKFWKISDLAKLLEVNPRTIMRLISRGEIRAVNMGTDKRAAYRIYDGELQRFMAENYEKNSCCEE